MCWCPLGHLLAHLGRQTSWVQHGRVQLPPLLKVWPSHTQSWLCWVGTWVQEDFRHLGRLELQEFIFITEMQSLWHPRGGLEGDISLFHLPHGVQDCRSPHLGNTFSGGGQRVFPSSGINAKASQEAFQDTRKEVAFYGLVRSKSHKNSLRDLNVCQGLTLHDFMYPTLVSSHPLSKVSKEAPQLCLSMQM